MMGLRTLLRRGTGENVEFCESCGQACNQACRSDRIREQVRDRALANLSGAR
jgi:hypothetical protein